MEKKIIIYYLIVNEDINSGLIQSQVIEPLNKQKRQVKIINLTKPFTNTLNQNSLNIPLAIPYKLFLFTKYPFVINFISLFYALILLLFIKRGSVVIARSYFPTIVSKILRSLKHIDSYIFDSRSLFIHENLKIGNIRENSAAASFWKRTEKEIINYAKKTIAVSKAQQKYYKSICPKADVTLIPCYASENTLISMGKREKLRAEKNITNQKVLIAYYGSLDDKWNNYDLYYSFFMEAIKRGYYIIIISQNFKQLCKIRNLNRKQITLVDTNKLSAKELLTNLQIADYGVILMEKSFDWESRLSIKFVEYLNNGLRPIVGEYVGEAVRLGKTIFKDRTLIYSNPQDINDLKSITDIKNDCRVQKIFGYHNLTKLLNEIS